MRALLTFVLALLSSAGAFAQRKETDTCPWCKNDPPLMAAAGLVSHGPVAMGPGTSEELVALCQGSWRFAETAHLRWASQLGAVAVDQSDRERVEAELARLRKALPSVPTKPKKLDPWLRLHLFAMKGEEFYGRFQELLAVTDADFPESRQATGPYMGNGRYLGEKEKFEVALHWTRESHRRWTESWSGVAVTDALRWHEPKLHKLMVSIPCEDSDLREDEWLWPHTVHNLSHVFLCAYKHFSYDPPIWLDEGLAHAMEKEANPRSTTTDGEEGAYRDNRGPSDWTAAAAKLAAGDKLAKIGWLFSLKEFGSLEMDAHISSWSLVRFLMEDRERCARFLGAVKGQLDSRGYPTGANLEDLVRASLKSEWGWSVLELEERWRASLEDRPKQK